MNTDSSINDNHHDMNISVSVRLERNTEINSQPSILSKS